MSTPLYDTIRGTIENRLFNGWSASTRQFIKFPGRAFVTPDVSDGQRWIEMAINFGEAFAFAMPSTGNRGINHLFGVATVNVFGPPDEGAGPVVRWADDVRAIFNRVQASGVRFLTPSGPQTILEPRQVWIQRSVSIPFQVVETVT